MSNDDDIMKAFANMSMEAYPMQNQDAKQALDALQDLWDDIARMNYRTRNETSPNVHDEGVWQGNEHSLLKLLLDRRQKIFIQHRRIIVGKDTKNAGQVVAEAQEFWTLVERMLEFNIRMYIEKRVLNRSQVQELKESTVPHFDWNAA